MYLSCELAHKQILGLETFWNESLWVEIKVNKESYLIGLFYSPRRQTLSSLVLPTKI